MDTAGISQLSPRTDPAIDRPDARRGQRVTVLDRWLAARVQQTIADGPVRLELWDGTSRTETLHRQSATSSSPTGAP